MGGMRIQAAYEKPTPYKYTYQEAAGYDKFGDAADQEDYRKNGNNVESDYIIAGVNQKYDSTKFREVGKRYSPVTADRFLRDNRKIVGTEQGGGVSNIILRRVKPEAPVNPEPETPKTNPVPTFDAASWSKPSAPEAEKPRYQLNTEASGYQKWLAENRPGTGSDSSSETPGNGSGGGDRVRFFQDKVQSGEPGAASASHYGGGGGGGERRMAGGRQFRERLSRYRS